MKSLQEYINIYRTIGRNLGVQGDSIELLAQMLGNASYISEVEHLSYSQEASLERSSQYNSKIQHCIDNMYSVFRGSCPRVIINILSNSIMDLKMYDEIGSFNNFNIYYLGYYDPAADSSLDSEEIPQFKYGPITLPANKELSLIALISPKCLFGEWKITSNNQYYVDFLESNLSNDLQLKVNGEIVNTTRIFSDHIKYSYPFDLTLPDFGLRIYAPNVFKDENLISTGTELSLKAFRYSELSSYNQSELKQIKIRGTKLIPFDTSIWHRYGTELSTGLIFVKEVSRDDLKSIHYKSQKNKYISSIFRSNSDIGALLEEMFPEKIYKSGTSYKFQEWNIIPQTTSTFGFLPDNAKLNETYRELAGKTSNDLESNETILYDLGKNNSLTIYSSNDNPVSVYFNDNKSISYTSPENPQITFKGSKLELTSQGTFINNRPYGGIVRVPISGDGTLRVYHKSSYDLSTESVYEILPSSSAIFRRNKELVTKVLKIDIIKTCRGVSNILSDVFFEDYYLKIIYNYTSSYSTGIKSDIVIKRDLADYKLSENRIISSDVYEVVIELYKYSDLVNKNQSDDNILLDREVLPIISIPSDKTSNTITTTPSPKPIGLVLDLSNDTISLESDYLGNIITKLPITVQASVFNNGEQVLDGVFFSIPTSSGIECSISENGLLTISSFSKFSKENIIIVKATYQGITVTSTVKIKTVLTEDALKTKFLNISDDLTGKSILYSVDSNLSGTLTEYKYKNVHNKNFLYLWMTGTPSIDIYSIEWISDNRFDLESRSSVQFPYLSIYYIPSLPTMSLTNKDIDDFINKRKSYFVSQQISINKGNLIKAQLLIEVELFKNTSIDSEVGAIMENYSNRFNIDLEKRKNELISLIGKISNVKSLNGLRLNYVSEVGEPIEYSDIDLDISYFIIEYQIISKVSSIID